MRIAVAIAILASASIAVHAQSVTPKDAGDIAKGVYSGYSIHLKSNQLEGVNRYNDGKRGNELIEGQTNCVPECRDKIAEMHKSLKKGAKTADQKKTVDAWRIEWMAAIGHPITHNS